MSESGSPTNDSQEAPVEDSNVNEPEGNRTEKVSETDHKPSKSDKIRILLRPASNAPIMKKQNWDVDPDKTVGKIMGFVKKYLKMQPSENLFLYVNQAFAPTPDQLIRNLYDCYGTDGKLTLYYYLGQAWG